MPLRPPVVTVPTAVRRILRCGAELVSPPGRAGGGDRTLEADLPGWAAPTSREPLSRSTRPIPHPTAPMRRSLVALLLLGTGIGAKRLFGDLANNSFFDTEVLPTLRIQVGAAF